MISCTPPQNSGLRAIFYFMVYGRKSISPLKNEWFFLLKNSMTAANMAMVGSPITTPIEEPLSSELFAPVSGVAGAGSSPRITLKEDDTDTSLLKIARIECSPTERVSRNSGERVMIVLPDSAV